MKILTAKDLKGILSQYPDNAQIAIVVEDSVSELWAQGLTEDHIAFDNDHCLWPKDDQDPIPQPDTFGPVVFINVTY